MSKKCTECESKQRTIDMLNGQVSQANYEYGTLSFKYRLNAETLHKVIKERLDLDDSLRHVGRLMNELQHLFLGRFYA